MNDSRNDPMFDLVEDYVLGVLEGTVLARFEARMAEDPALEAEVRSAREALGALAFSAPVAPTPELKGRVMALISPGTDESGDAESLLHYRNRKPSHRPHRKWPIKWALAASVLLAFFFGYQYYEAYTGLTDALAMVTAREKTLSQRDSLIAQLTDPGTEVVSLAATTAGKSAIKAYVDKRRRRVLLTVASLQAPQPGRTYQLWFIVGGKPVPSVTFKPYASGHVYLSAVPMPDGAVAATAITSEPEGGSTTPTMPILFVGKVATE